MTHPTPDTFAPQRLEAHAALFDRLSKLRTLLDMLHANGFEHFHRLEANRQAEYLWMCKEHADGAYDAMLVSDGVV
ncbi:hypothetical protein PI87_14320 [Ralstonia sp. A12]|uniref:hypothetical protein n=1 Tax=Ralstonia sp. A12 TaxID=1217052 RepID=UPI000573AB0D|nr:hypothetical protein [Ralstonia sp. A12]KHK54777.1 hypothetical protein PI87_14320 [Ralstonia sp. A12]